MIKIFEMLLPLALALVSKYLKSRDDLKELDKDFINFVTKLESKPNTIAKVSGDYESQLAEARAKAKANKEKS